MTGPSQLVSTVLMFVVIMKHAVKKLSLWNGFNIKIFAYRLNEWFVTCMSYI